MFRFSTFLIFFVLSSNIGFTIIFQAIISTSRLSRFLCCPEIETETSGDNHSSCTDKYSCVTSEDVAVVINEVSCMWSSNDQEQLVMDRVSLSLSKGHLVAVVGEVSTLFIFCLYATQVETNSTHIYQKLI